MKFNLEKYSGISIHSYETGLLRLAIPQAELPVNEVPLQSQGNGLYTTHSNIILGPSLLQAWEIQSIEQLNMNLLSPVLALEPEITLIGTGSTAAFPSSDCMRDIYSSGAALDFMDTAAACRTYNILLSERRHVVAAMIML